ncbi:LemA family protein [bacterium]|nr:LemA family protein [bacterium]
MSGLVIVLIVVAAIIAFIIPAYNKGVSLRNYVREAFSTMDVYLKKRWDLIPNLVETVKGYAQHEKGLLTELTDLRTKNYGGMSDNEKLQANMQLGSVLPKILAVAENYPDLKANQNFAKLMDDLSAIESDIVNARKYYNGTVREYNTFLEVFPTNIVGAIFSFRHAELFEISSGERENVQVKF